MKKKAFIWVICSLMVFLAIGQRAVAQEVGGDDADIDDSIPEVETVEKDTTDIVTNPNRWRPRTAALLSIIPGLGQMYNGNPWKIPIIYTGFAFFWYQIEANNEQYRYWLAPYVAANDVLPGTIPQSTLPSESNISSAKDYYRRERDFYIIVMALWYGLNIVEAAVDAHLSVYDVSDDLTVTFEPTVITDDVTLLSAVGVSFKLKLK